MKGEIEKENVKRAKKCYDCNYHCSYLVWKRLKRFYPSATPWFKLRRSNDSKHEDVSKDKWYLLEPTKTVTLLYIDIPYNLWNKKGTRNKLMNACDPISISFSWPRLASSWFCAVVITLWPPRLQESVISLLLYYHQSMLV